VPLRAEYVGILRAACAQLGPLLGCGPAEIADLQLAVDEASGLLLRNCVTAGHDTEQDTLAATFAIAGPGLHITLATEADASVAPDDGEFGWAILTSLVDEFSWRVEGSTVCVEIRKLHVDGKRE
jgi:anti-sigma regulatory factor (Ser/Thr protein kinase)